jgi:type II secretory pathway component GspD/PulD (secretin)
MKKMTIICVCVVLSGLFCAHGVTAQEPPAKTNEMSRPEMTVEVIQLKYISTRDAMTLVEPYLNRGYGATVTPNTQLKLMTVKDMPETIRKIKEILAVYDVKPLDLQFSVELIKGSTEPGKTDADLKADSFIRELQKVLSYKSYERIGSSVIRVQDNSRTEQRIGGVMQEATENFKPHPIQLILSLQPSYVKDGRDELFQVDVDLRWDKFASEKEAVRLLNTTLSMKNGEKTVVGVSKLNGDDSSLILILTVRIIR